MLFLSMQVTPGIRAPLVTHVQTLTPHQVGSMHPYVVTMCDNVIGYIVVYMYTSGEAFTVYSQVMYIHTIYIHTYYIHTYIHLP